FSSARLGRRPENLALHQAAARPHGGARRARMQFEPWPQESHPAGPVTDDDIDQILRTMDERGGRKRVRFATLDRARRVSLRDEINGLWSTVKGAEDWQKIVLPRHEELKLWEDALEQVQALRETLNTMARHGMSLVDYAEPECILPNRDPRAVAEVRDARTGLGKIANWSANACAQLGALGRQKKRPNTAQRYFVRELAKIYTRTFGQRPGKTQGGHWELFLQEMLKRCTGEEMKPGGVHTLWLNASKS